MPFQKVGIIWDVREGEAFAYWVLGQAGYCPRKCFACDVREGEAFAYWVLGQAGYCPRKCFACDVREGEAFAYWVLGQAGYCPRKCFAPTGVVLFGAIATFGLVVSINSDDRCLWVIESQDSQI